MTHATRGLFPVIRFGNADAMIRWLGEAFGLIEHVVYRDDAGSIIHAELAFGPAMIMIGQARDDAFARIIGHPNGPGGKAIYLAVEDAAATYARAKAAGATIVEEPVDRDYGSREFVCLDPEGNVWSIGTYLPGAIVTPDRASD